MRSYVLLDAASLARTVWNLEDARTAGITARDPAVTEALRWVASRHGKPGAYRAVLAAPTEDDLQSRRCIPTGEDGSVGRGGAAHILGEEAARALALWGHEAGWDRAKVLAAVSASFRPSATGAGLTRPGHFCCARCSVARWRTLTAGQPAGWEDAVRDGLQILEDDFDAASGRWRRFPFYYTMLAIRDMPAPLGAGWKDRLAAAAARAAPRLTAGDAATRARRRAIEWALG